MRKIEKLLIVTVTGFLWVFLGFLVPEVRSEVLFLVHYNKSLNADYSCGDGKAEVVGDVKITSDKGGYLFSDSQPSPEALDIGYTTSKEGRISYPTKGNIDFRQGTVEMWVKTLWDWETKDVLKYFEHGYEPSFIHFPFIGEGAEAIGVGCYHYYIKETNIGWLHVGFDIFDGRKDHTLYKRVDARGGWEKGTWHHIAFSWTAMLRRLFVDGELVEEKQNEPPAYLTGFEEKFYVGWMPGRSNARVLIDEIRILDEPVDKIVLEQVERKIRK